MPNLAKCMLVPLLLVTAGGAFSPTAAEELRALVVEDEAPPSMELSFDPLRRSITVGAEDASGSDLTLAAIPYEENARRTYLAADRSRRRNASSLATDVKESRRGESRTWRAEVGEVAFGDARGRFAEAYQEVEIVEDATGGVARLSQHLVVGESLTWTAEYSAETGRTTIRTQAWDASLGAFAADETRTYEGLLVGALTIAPPVADVPPKEGCWNCRVCKTLGGLSFNCWTCPKLAAAPPGGGFD